MRSVLPPFGEKEHGGGDARVGTEDAGRHGDNSVEPVFLDQFLASFDVRVGRAEQDAVRHDDRAAAAIVEQAKEQMQEKDFGFLDLGRERRVHIACVDRAFERRIGEDNVVAAFFVECLRERIGVVEARDGEAVEHEVHAADAEHGHAGIAVVAGERLVL